MPREGQQNVLLEMVDREVHPHDRLPLLSFHTPFIPEPREPRSPGILPGIVPPATPSHHRGGGVTPLGQEGHGRCKAPRKGRQRPRRHPKSSCPSDTDTGSERSRPLVWTMSPQISALKGGKQTKTPRTPMGDEIATETEP